MKVEFFAKTLRTDPQSGKALNFRLHSFQYPHMRSLHLAWFSFMIGFLSWYAIPPVMPHIAADLGISAEHVYDSNVISVAATILARFSIGPFCERFGPRRVMASMLVLGAVPCAMTALVQNASGLIGLRFVIGILGGIFVPTQFWATQMFAPSVIGTANAITGGWGNMGGGATYIVMPAVYDGLRKHLSQGVAWRVAFVVPAGLCVLMAILDLLFGTDTPHGDWFKKRSGSVEEPDIPSSESVDDDKYSKNDKAKPFVEVKPVENDEDETIGDVKRDESALKAILGSFRMFGNPAVVIMAAVYACSLGVELAIDNVIGRVFETKFNLDPSKAAYIGSIFGLLNIFSRLTGGLFSDYMAYKFHMPGRILALLLSISLEGIFLIGFGFGLINLPTSITIMVCFSFFVQHVCGSTYAIVPFIDAANNGKVMGIVGAGGNLGGLVFNVMFRGFGNQFAEAFFCLGGICIGVAILGCALLRVQNKTIWQLKKSTHAHLAQI